MTIFTSIGSTALPNVWRWLKRRSKQRLGYVPMRARHTSPVRSIFIKDTSIMIERLFAGWELLTKACPMTLGYSHSRVTLSVTARAVIKKRRYAISSAQLSSTHATASCCGRSPLAITIFGAIRRKKELWIASWRSGQMTST